MNLNEIALEVARECGLLGVVPAEVAHLTTEERYQLNAYRLVSRLGAQQEPFDAEDQRFRTAFDETLQNGNWPATRKGYGYRSPMSNMAFSVAFGTVNRLKLYAAPMIPADQLLQAKRDALLEAASICRERGERNRIAAGLPNGDRDEFYCADDITRMAAELTPPSTD